MIKRIRRRHARWEPPCPGGIDPTDGWWLRAMYGGVPAVYVIYADDKIVYVGSSCSVGDRIASHGFKKNPDQTYRTPWGSCSRLYAKIRCSLRLGDELRREIRLIRRLKPRFNKRGKVAA